MRNIGFALLYLASSGLSYVATRAAIRSEFPVYNWAESGVEVSAALVRQCQSYCIAHKVNLVSVSPLACTCNGGTWVRFQ